MKIPKCVYTGKTEKGTDIIIRYPCAADVSEMLEFINTLSKEQTFILSQGEQLTLKEEQKYLDSALERIANHEAVYLQVYTNGHLIGASDVVMKDKAEKHVGLVGISIAKQYRSEGIGKLLMTLVLKEAREQLPLLKIFTLSVFDDNEIAKTFYPKMGFKPYGTLPNGIKHKDTFVDHIHMYQNA